MDQQANALILEILREEGQLKMSLCEQKDLGLTIRNYSRCSVSFDEINRLCLEIVSVLNKADRKGELEPDLAKDLKYAGQILWDQMLRRSVKDKTTYKKITDFVSPIAGE